MVTLAAQYTWAFAFPSWFGVVMIVWTVLAVYPENPGLYFKSSFLLIAFAGAITLLDLLYFVHNGIIADNVSCALATACACVHMCVMPGTA